MSVALLLEASNGATGRICFSPDGTRVAATGTPARLWDARSGGCVATLGNCQDLAFSREGAEIATIAASHVKLWDAATGAFTRGFDAAAAAWHAENGLLLLRPDSTDARRVVVLDSMGEPGRIVGPSVGEPQLSPCGRFVAMGTGTMWSTESGELLWSAPHVEYDHKVGDALRLEFSPGGQRTVIDTYYAWACVVLDSATGRTLRRLGNHTGPAISADGGTCAHGEGNGAIEVWRIRERSLWSRLTEKENTTLCTVEPGWGDEESAASLLLSADGNRLVTGGWATPARVWDAAGVEIARAEGGRPAALSPDGSRVAMLGDEGLRLVALPTSPSAPR